MQMSYNVKRTMFTDARVRQQYSHEHSDFSTVRARHYVQETIPFNVANDGSVLVMKSAIEKWSQAL